MDTYELRGYNPVKPHILKDPTAVLDYPIDWTEWLAEIGDTIASHSWPVVTNGVVVASSTDDGLIVTPFISGGTLGATASATCRIVTALGRTDERTLYFMIRNR